MTFYDKARGYYCGARYMRGHHHHYMRGHHHPRPHYHHHHHGHGHQQHYNRQANFISLMQSDLSTSMMVVYPDGGVGFISTAAPDGLPPLFDEACSNDNNNHHQQLMACMADVGVGGSSDDQPPTPLHSTSEISVKSAPAEYSGSTSVVEDHHVTYKPGDECLAPYIDGNYYPARFEAAGLADLCAVFFHSFGHHSYVPIAAIIPSSPSAPSS